MFWRLLSNDGKTISSFLPSVNLDTRVMTEKQNKTKLFSVVKERNSVSWDFRQEKVYFLLRELERLHEESSRVKQMWFVPQAQNLRGCPQSQ